MPALEIGHPVYVPPDCNKSWTGWGEVIREPIRTCVVVMMHTGQRIGSTGGFFLKDVIPFQAPYCYCGQARSEEDYACENCRSPCITI